MQDKTNLRVVNLSGDYILPRVSENRTRKPWVCYGIEAEDDFYSLVTKKYQTSPTQQASVDGITQLLFGLGLKSDDILVNVQLDQLTDPEEIKRIVLDYKLYGQCAIQLVFNPMRSGIVGFYHLPIDTLRAEKCGDDGNIHGYYYSSDWTNKKITPTYIPSYGESEYESDVQVLVSKRYTPGMFYYSTPDWYSCIQYCSVEEEISNLHISNIRNGFMPSAMINFNSGLPAPEEQSLIENSIANKFAGSSNAGRFILSFNENKEEAASIDIIKSENLHENYNFLSEEASRKIMLAHRITSPLMFGIKVATGFSSNADELKTSYDVMDKMVIVPMQGELLRIFNTVLAINGIPGDKIYFEKLVPYEIEAQIKNDVGAPAADQIIQDQGQNQTDKPVTDQTVQPIGNE